MRNKRKRNQEPVKGAKWNIKKESDGTETGSPKKERMGETVMPCGVQALRTKGKGKGDMKRGVRKGIKTMSVKRKGNWKGNEQWKGERKMIKESEGTGKKDRNNARKQNGRRDGRQDTIGRKERRKARRKDGRKRRKEILNS